MVSMECEEEGWTLTEATLKKLEIDKMWVTYAD